jgi:hypothetical protein
MIRAIRQIRRSALPSALRLRLEERLSTGVSTPFLGDLGVLGGEVFAFEFHL